MLPKTFDPDALRTIALGALGVNVILAIVVARFVRMMVMRVILIGALVGLGVYAWYEREELKDCVPTCACSVAGFDVQVPGCPKPDA